MNWLVNLYYESPLSTSNFVDWLDIGLLTYIIYRLFVVIRGTRGQQVVIGLGLLVFVFAVSKLAGLSTMSWVLDHLAVYVALALLILFQEDIRRALARAGGTVFRSSANITDARMLEEVIKALFNLAHRKIGALVVIERGASLNRHAEEAHTINAKVSAELLQSIFHPSSPLHDGAVIIQAHTIASAGVFVPISLGKDIPRAYGTRHRAAIGLTEATDAICIVVSEERGTVVLVKDGKMIPVADPNDLRHLLLEKMEELPASPEELTSGENGVARG
ncbi:MAG: TIGR00159 family protein [Proteobacteria bacterium]|jgi:diadenylate cyclase|nr:TIGR00159 family protein [Pseudomonadota bacterium]